MDILQPYLDAIIAAFAAFTLSNIKVAGRSINKLVEAYVNKKISDYYSDVKPLEHIVWAQFVITLSQDIRIFVATIDNASDVRKTVIVHFKRSYWWLFRKHLDEIIKQADFNEVPSETIKKQVLLAINKIQEEEIFEKMQTIGYVPNQLTMILLDRLFLHHKVITNGLNTTFNDNIIADTNNKKMWSFLNHIDNYLKLHSSDTIAALISLNSVVDKLMLEVELKPDRN